MNTDPNDAPAEEAKPTRTRTSKTPEQAARGNIQTATNALESLGARLFKLDRTDLIPLVSQRLADLRELGAALEAKAASMPKAKTA